MFLWVRHAIIRGAGMHDAPLRMSVWEAKVKVKNSGCVFLETQLSQYHVQLKMGASFYNLM